MKSPRFTLCMTALLLLALSALIGFSFAQASQQAPAAKTAQTAATPAQTALRVTEITIKPAMVIEWESFLKTDAIPALKKGGAKWLGTWRIAEFGNPNKYIIMGAMPEMAELDKPNEFLKTVGQETVVALMAKLQRFVDSTRNYMLVGQPNLTIDAQKGYEPKLGVLVTNTVAPGRESDFERNSKEVMAVIGKTNAKAYLTGRVLLGGDPNRYMTFVAFDNFAEIGKFGPAFGKAISGAKMSPEAGVVLHREYEVIALVPELSFELAP